MKLLNSQKTICVSEKDTHTQLPVEKVAILLFIISNHPLSKKKPPKPKESITDESGHSLS